MPSPAPSPIAIELSEACSERIRRFHDEQTRQLLVDMLAAGISNRDQLGALMGNAAHMSAHCQARVELMTIGALSTGEQADLARAKVRRYFEKHVPRARERMVDILIRGLEREREVRGG